MDDLTKAIRSCPRMIVVSLILLFCISFLANYHWYSKGKPVELKVTSHSNRALHYNELLTDEGLFQSGSEGIISVTPRSFTETCMLKYITSSTFNLVDCIYFLSIACFIWWMTYDIRKEDVFSEKVISGFGWISLSIVFYGILKGFNYFLVNAFIDHYTRGVFGAPESEFFEFRFVLAAMFFS